MSVPTWTDDELREGLTTCLAVPRWVAEIVVRGPYDSVAGLVEVARTAADPLTAEEVDQALAHHPRIGERPAGDGRSSQLSRAEQAASTSEDPELAAALAAGNRAYEERFGRVFLIRAAGRSRREILDELQRRLDLDPATEVRVVAEQLREIALLRIPQVFPQLHHESYAEPEAAQ